MRPGQNNKQRMRGRPTNNRRGPNPLTRSYESNGPDIKIRGNAHHVAEKYLQLARDAHTGGDPVAAENYLQHAEHYFRLIAAAQAAQLAAQGRPPGEVDDSDADEDDDSGVLDRFASPVERIPAYTPPPPPQPVPLNGPSSYPERQPYEAQQPERNGFQPRPDRPQQQNRHENRNPRPFQDRGDGQRDYRNGQPQEGRAPREFRPYREQNPQREPQPVIEAPAPAALPSFITAPPRAPTGVEVPDAPQPAIEPVEPNPVVEAAAPAPAEAAAPDARFPRGRRRRLRSPYGFNAAGEEGAPSEPPVPSEPTNAD